MSETNTNIIHVEKENSKLNNEKIQKGETNIEEKIDIKDDYNKKENEETNSKIVNYTEEDKELIKFLILNLQKINRWPLKEKEKEKEKSDYIHNKNNSTFTIPLEKRDTITSISYTYYQEPENEKESKNENPESQQYTENRLKSITKCVPRKDKLTSKGSLFELFKSELFTIHLLLNYMNKYNESTIFDCLVNEIYERHINNCYFYLPQLCSMLVYKDSISLEQFLTEHCTDRLKFAVKIYWLIISLRKTNIHLENKAVKIEIAMVNNKIRKQKIENNGESIPLNIVYQKSLSKEIRLNYFIKLCSFYDQLTIICDNLMKVSKEERRKLLDSYIEKLNINISKLKKNINLELKDDINSYFHYGYLLPFDDSESTYDEETNLIVKILPENSSFFNSKARVPIVLTFEIVKVKEMKNWDELIENDPEGMNYTNMNTDNNGFIKQSSNIIEYESIDDFLNKNFIKDSELEKEVENIATEENLDKNEKKVLENIKIEEEIEKEKREIQEIGTEKNHDGKLTENEFIKDLKASEKQTEKINLKNDGIISIKTDSKKKVINNKDSISPIEYNLKTNPNEEPKIEKEFKNSLNTSENAQEQSYFKTCGNFISSKTLESKMEKLENKNKQFEISNYNCKNNPYGLIDWNSVDPKFNPFGKPWILQMEEIKRKSKFRNFQTYQIKSFLYKSNDDLKQELMIQQLIKRCQEIFNTAGIPLKLGVYEILITSERSGMIEIVNDTCSIDKIKKHIPENLTLKDFYLQVFGMNFEEAQINFAQSLAAYSVICYLFQIKDRHNGNILIDNCGHIIHIDFGFVFGINPGNINFESVPFKLTQEFIDILGGYNSEIFEYYVLLIMKALMELKKHVDNFVSIVEIMRKGCDMPCFILETFEQRIQEFRQRFNSNNKEDFYQYARNLVSDSANSWRTNKYDSYQKFTQGILY